MSKRFLILLAVAALLPAAAFGQSYSAILTGAAQAPEPGDTDGSGMAVIRFEGTTVHYNVWTQGIGTPTAAHIHTGAAGSTGAPLITLDVNQLTNGSTPVTQEVANQVTANPGGFYVNVHTSEFPNGAVRGQLVAAPAADGAMVAYLPVVSKTAGGFGTNFVTDVRVVNVGGATASVTLDFYAANPAGTSGPTASATVSVGPGEQKVLDDVLNGTLGVTGGYGGLKVSSTQDVLVTARIINDLRSQGSGTAGFVMGAEEVGATASTLSFLSQNADYRTNIGYFNYSSSPVTITFTAHGTAEGAVLGTNTVTVPALSMLQQPAFSLISSVPEASRTQADFYVTWTSTAPVLVYGAVTDNRTGDAVVSQ